MKTSFKRGAAALVVFGALAGASSAANAVLAVPAGSSAFVPFAALVGKSSFSNSYSFSLGGTSNLAGVEFSSFLSGFSAKLDGITLQDTKPSLAGFQFGAANLGVGSHTLTFAGTGTTALLSGYIGAFHLTPAVPEPATLAMGLLAAGLLGGLAKRRRRG